MAGSSIGYSGRSLVPLGGGGRRRLPAPPGRGLKWEGAVCSRFLRGLFIKWLVGGDSGPPFLKKGCF